MGGFSQSDIGWVALSAFVTVLAGALAIRTKIGLSWVGRKIKEAFNRAFAEAVDEHVEPKFAQLREESLQAAAEVREDLRLHTAEESEIVRRVVKEEITPIVERLDQIEANQLEGTS